MALSDPHFAKNSRSISGRGKAKYANIIPAELRGAFIPNLERGGRDAFGARYHECSGLKQTHPLLVLQGAERSDSFEVPVKR